MKRKAFDDDTIHQIKKLCRGLECREGLATSLESSNMTPVKANQLLNSQIKNLAKLTEEVLQEIDDSKTIIEELDTENKRLKNLVSLYSWKLKSFDVNSVNNWY